MRKILTTLFLLVSLCAYPLTPAILPHYIQENGKWYWGVHSEKIEVVGADVNSFRLVCTLCRGTPFAKDNYSVFFAGQRIEGANPHTWELIITEAVQRVQQHLYSRDDRNVFFRGQKIEGADRDTFEDITIGVRHIFSPSFSTFGRDKNAVFRGAVRTSYDVATFRKLSREGFMVDKSGVYFRERLLEGSCFTDFREESVYHTISNGRVFFRDLEIEGADANSFRFSMQRISPFALAPAVEYTIARDRNHIFIDNQKMTELDVETFVVIDSCDWEGAIVRDKNGTFRIRRGWGEFSLVPIETE